MSARTIAIAGTPAHQVIDGGVLHLVAISSAGGAWTLAGLSGGQDGQHLLLVNRSGFNLTIAHEDGTIPVRQRVTTDDATAHIVANNHTALLVYDWLAGRWLLHGVSDAAVPRGMISLWSGSVASIPAGWALCDGTLGTPDLRDRFLVGAGSTYAVGAAAGATTHTHAGHAAHVVTQPGAHAAHVVTQPSAHSNHVVTQPSAHTNHVVTQPGAHAALATHQHELPFIKVAGGTGALRMLAATVFGTGTSRAPESVSAAPTALTTAAAVELSEAKSAGTPDAHVGTAVDAHSAHAGTAVDAHSAHAGTAVDAHSAHDAPSHLPPYYALAYIMKL